MKKIFVHAEEIIVVIIQQFCKHNFKPFEIRQKPINEKDEMTSTFNQYLIRCNILLCHHIPWGSGV